MMLLFRHNLLTRLLAANRITRRTVEILDNFRHPGFSVHQGGPVAPGDTKSRERMAAYLLNPPIALARMDYDPAAGQVHYKPKPPAEEGRHGG